MNEEKVIIVDHISKVYHLYDRPIHRLKETFSLTKKCYHKDYTALNDISFDVKKGEILGIIGKNGSGKSTILKIITHVLTPTSGNITVKGKVSALLELGAGFNMEYSGIENAYLNGQMIGFTKEEMDEKIDAIVEFADIGDFIYQPVKTYSSGMFARLAFSVAISVDPDILIVDEALSVGDVFFQNKCFKKFEEFRERGKTILFVTHDMGSVIRYCDRAVLLNAGDMIAEGNPNDMIDIYKKVMVGEWKPGQEKEDHSVALGVDENAWMKQITVNPSMNIYGNMKIQITDFGIFDYKDRITNNIFKGDMYKIKVKYHINEAVESPIFTYKLKDIKGNELTGTNTMFERIDTTNLAQGSDIVVTFTQKQLLQPGQYLLSLGCTGYEGDDFIVYERIYDACNVGVVSEKVTVGFFDSETQIDLEVI